MKGLSSTGRARIEALVENMFENLSYDLFGFIPGVHKKVTFSVRKPTYNLLNLFLEALGNREPSDSEKDYAKGIVKNASNYVTGLKEKTKSAVVEAVNSHVASAESKGQKPSKDEISKIVAREMSKAKSHLQLITQTETTKVRNSAVESDITRVGRSLNIEDPSVYFVVLRDNITCKHCINNHLMPDKATPRVMKLSDVKKTYLSTQDRKDGMVSIAGQHPHCRCSMVFLAPGFGFEKGRMTWIGYGHDELNRQKAI
jgi:hypothetical protein